MAENTQNIIRYKYSELIRLISLISDDVRIEDKGSKLSLTIDVYIDERKFLSFKLYKLSETQESLEVAWSILGWDTGHWSFPDFLNQRYMFNTLVSKITEWYTKVINSNIDTLLKQVQDTIK